LLPVIQPEVFQYEKAFWDIKLRIPKMRIGKAIGLLAFASSTAAIQVNANPQDEKGRFVFAG
jgi:hypothetical protein|tara:strand:+ start:3797 stop:3982 length:186 start_codon:yes stop_codon:yes gene_type:complete